ncbi:hypothetical protein [Marinicella sp. W31]|uniref:hypothetical protein n=1 Tax=Marinicella sp. W31 TaxID=3023713 RepID=UPI0037563A23
MKKPILFLILMYFINPVRAEQIFQFCNNCYIAPDFQHAAEIFSQTLSAGDHSIVLVNDNSNQVWDVRVRVTSNSGGDFFPVIGDNSVEILSTEFNAEASEAYADMKELIEEPFVVDARLAPQPYQGYIESLCPTANNGYCTALNNYLFNLPRTYAFRSYLNTGSLLHLVWRRLRSEDMLIIVVFPDGSIGAYEYNGGLSPSSSISPVGNTATGSNGQIATIGGYIGLDDDVNVPGNSNIPNGGSGGSGNCTIAITSVDNEVYRITVTCE